MDAEYKDMNESAPIPSLTLEPELENCLLYTSPSPRDTR